MAKTYTLQSTSVNGGRGNRTYDFSGYSTDTTISSGGRYGYYNSMYRATNILFDANTLASLRTKTVTSIKLTLTFTIDTSIPSSGTTQFPIGYKLNSSATDWTRSDANSTAASTTVAAGYVRTTGEHYNIKAGNSYTFDITGSSIPKYGYSIGYTGSASSAYHVIGATATLTVVTNETDYTLKLSYNGNATNASSVPSAQSATVTTSGTPSYTFTISSTRPTRTGYNFLGWSTSSTATTASYQPSGTITISANTTLYAVWQKITYTISYNKGTYGTGTNTSDTKDYGVNLTLKGVTFTREGYTQTGWSTSANGDTFAYSLQGTYSANASVTLYPFWTINTYVVSYNKGTNGTGNNTTDVKTYGVALSLKQAIFTRTGYTQTGWSTSDGGAKAYELGASYTANSAVTLFPFWSINTYTVSYDKGSYGVGTNTTDTKTYNVALTLKGAIFTRSGYYQSGWSTSDGGAYAYALSDSYTSESNITLYPVWTAYSITIKFHVNGGAINTGTGTTRYRVSNSIVQRSTDSGTTWSDLTNTITTATVFTNLWNVETYGATKNGYHITSESAYRVGSTSGTVINQDTTSTSDVNASTIQNITGSSTLQSDVTVTLYINWLPDEYTVSYNANGGDGAPTPQTKYYGIPLTLSSVIPTYGAFEFLGWADSSSAISAQYQPSGTFTENNSRVLYAVWQQSSFIRIMGSDGQLKSAQLYVMTSSGLKSATLYKMGSDGVLHPQG